MSQLSTEQIQRTLERHGVSGDVEILGIDYPREGPITLNLRGRKLAVPEDVISSELDDALIRKADIFESSIEPEPFKRPENDRERIGHDPLFP